MPCMAGVQSSRAVLHHVDEALSRRDCCLQKGVPHFLLPKLMAREYQSGHRKDAKHKDGD